MLYLNQVHKSYGSGHTRVDVLRELDFSVEAGRFIAVTGKSGSGKSTLLNLMAGIDRPDRGNILFEKADLNTLSQEQLADFRLTHIGLVFQFFNLLPTLSLEENIRIPGYLAGMRKKELKHRTETAIGHVGLNNARNRMPHEASGGENQRAAIARALINEPSLILADEPTGNLDRKNAGSVISLLRTLVREKGKTAILVTHDPDLTSICDAVYHLEDGKLRQ